MLHLQKGEFCRWKQPGGVSWSHVLKLPDTWITAFHGSEEQRATIVSLKETWMLVVFPSVQLIKLSKVKIYYLQLKQKQLVFVSCCKYANEFRFEIKQNIGCDSWTWERKWNGLHAAALLNIISIIPMNRVQFTSSESLPSRPVFPPKEQDYCASDLQQIGRLVAHHSAITQAFIYLHMQARMKNVSNSHKSRCTKQAALTSDGPKMCDVPKIMGGPEKQERSRT